MHQGFWEGSALRAKLRAQRGHKLPDHIAAGAGQIPCWPEVGVSRAGLGATGRSPGKRVRVGGVGLVGMGIHLGACLEVEAPGDSGS